MSTDHQHVHSGEPVEQDAVSFSGIGWFIVILVGTTLACQLIVWGLFEFSEWRVARTEAPRAVMAPPVTSPTIENGVLSTGAETAPQPALLVNEPMFLGSFIEQQRQMRDTYGWIDQAMGTIRLPIDRAKDLVLERGLPARTESAGPAAPDAVDSMAGGDAAAPAN